MKMESEVENMGGRRGEMGRRGGEEGDVRDGEINNCGASYSRLYGVESTRCKATCGALSEQRNTSLLTIVAPCIEGRCIYNCCTRGL